MKNQTFIFVVLMVGALLLIQNLWKNSEGFNSYRNIHVNNKVNECLNCGNPNAGYNQLMKTIKEDCVLTNPSGKKDKNYAKMFGYFGFNPYYFQYYSRPSNWGITNPYYEKLYFY